MSHINIRSGREVSIKTLTKIIKNIVNYNGKIKFDTTKPNGALRKLTNIRRLIKIGFKHKTDLEEGLKQVYMDFKGKIHLKSSYIYRSVAVHHSDRIFLIYELKKVF